MGSCSFGLLRTCAVCCFHFVPVSFLSPAMGQHASCKMIGSSSGSMSHCLCSQASLQQLSVVHSSHALFCQRYKCVLLGASPALLPQCQQLRTLCSTHMTALPRSKGTHHSTIRATQAAATASVVKRWRPLLLRPCATSALPARMAGRARRCRHLRRWRRLCAASISAAATSCKRQTCRRWAP